MALKLKEKKENPNGKRAHLHIRIDEDTNHQLSLLMKIYPDLTASEIVRSCISTIAAQEAKAHGK
jgi:hypothetical protein